MGPFPLLSWIKVPPIRLKEAGAGIRWLVELK